MTKCSRCRIGMAAAKTFIIAALIFLTVRSLAIEIFAIPPENNYIAPGGKVMVPESKAFSFAVASDSGAKNAPIERIVRLAQDEGNQFILYLGDLVRYRNISHFRWIISELDEKLEFPFYMIPGNHEIANHFGRQDKSLYKMLFGPLYYWFSYGDVMFIGLDSSEEKYNEAQLSWLEDVLEKIRPHYKYCIVYTHVPPLSKPQWKKKIYVDRSTERMTALLLQHRVDLILAGHIHQYWKGETQGIPVVTLMSSGQKTRGEIEKFGYLTVQISEDGIGKIVPHYLEDNYEDDNEYIELLLSNILVDERSLLICLLTLGIGLVLAACAFICGCER